MRTILRSELTNNQQKLLLEIQTFNIIQGKIPTVDQLKGIARIPRETLPDELNQMIALGILEASSEDFEDLNLLRNSMIKKDGRWMTQIPIIGGKAERRRKVRPRQPTEESVCCLATTPSELYFAIDISKGCLGISQDDLAPWGGDMLIARQQPFAEDGNFVVVLFNDELLIRKLSMSDKYPQLLANDPRFMSIEVSPNVSFRILGTVVARHFPVRWQRCGRDVPMLR